jgi:hypothetical protein
MTGISSKNNLDPLLEGWRREIWYAINRRIS